MKNIIPENKKIRVIALGCGSKIPELLMKKGASDWLDSIHLLYSYDSISNYFGGRELLDEWTKDGNKFVSSEMVESIEDSIAETYDEEPPFITDNLITFIFTGTLGYEGQREDRVNQFFVNVVGEVTSSIDHVILNSELSREHQEEELCEYILDYFMKAHTQVILAGSFDPFHAGHQSLLDASTKSGATTLPVIIDITNTHPTKGVIEAEVVGKRIEQIEASVKECGREYTIIESNAALFIDKYNIYNLSHPDKLIVFVIGSDVWDDYGKSFEKDFKGILNVSFLVFSRGDNEGKHRPSYLLHPKSFSLTAPEETRKLSSTQLRKETEETTNE